MNQTFAQRRDKHVRLLMPGQYPIGEIAFDDVPDDVLAESIARANGEILDEIQITLKRFEHVLSVRPRVAFEWAEKP